MRVSTLLQKIDAFLCRLFRQACAAPPAVVELSAPAAVESQVLRRPQRYFGKGRTRGQLQAMLGRIDGGGKHYGSKRSGSTHKGGGGKRSRRR